VIGKYENELIKKSQQRVAVTAKTPYQILPNQGVLPGGSR
jgi:hypothetical protein